jgi:calcineurin-like phosphoesterase family protein
MRKKTRQIFFFSDPHFNHESAIRFSNRPFRDLDHQREEIRKRWNNKVSPGDIVYVLGDVFFKIESPEKEKEYLDSLNGKKILIKGNHDTNYSLMRRCGFDEVYEEVKIKIGKSMIIRMCHYPYRMSLYKFIYYNLRHSIVKFLGLRIKSWGIRLKDYMRRPVRPLLKEEYLAHGHTHSKLKRTKDMINCCVEARGYAPAHLNELIKDINDYKNNKENRCLKIIRYYVTFSRH